MTDLFTPLDTPLGELPHRIVMAPLTRNRAGEDGVPSDLHVEYYRQRAGAALIITEGSQPSAVGKGYLGTPGFHSEEQVAGWRRVADAVHAEGGKIVAQLMHAGRIAHPDNKGGLESIAPSAIAAPGQMVTADGQKDHPTPRALEESEIPGVVQDYVTAARNAIEAGLDGVEVHAANGYLIHQFLAPGSNTREDSYGGSPENRARFAIEVTRAVADTIGPERTAIRLSPGVPTGGIAEGQENDDLYRYLVAELDKIGLAYLHVLSVGNDGLLRDIRGAFGGVLVLNRPGRQRNQVGTDVAAGIADIEAVGVMALANPDLPKRLKTGAPVNDVRKELFYAGGSAEGYTDYPALGTT